MIDFKFKTETQYMIAATDMLLEIPDVNCADYDEYNNLMDEFMYFCEVSGSGKQSI